MALDINKTYSVPGWALALLVTAAGGGLVWGGFDLNTAYAESLDVNKRVEVDLSASGKSTVVGLVNGELCDAIEAQLALPADSCTAAKVLSRAVGNIDLTAVDRDDPPDGDRETVMMGVQLRLPGQLSVDMP